MDVLNQLPALSVPTPFMQELKRIVDRSGLTHREIAYNSQSQLSRALQGTMPRRDTLMDWCETLNQKGKITRIDAERLLNLAGYATPKQHDRARTATTEQRVITKP